MQVDGFPLEMFPLILTQVLRVLWLGEHFALSHWLAEAGFGAAFLFFSPIAGVWVALCLSFPLFPFPARRLFVGTAGVPSLVAQGTRGGVTNTSDRDSVVPTRMGQRPRGML